MEVLCEPRVQVVQHVRGIDLNVGRRVYQNQPEVSAAREASNCSHLQQVIAQLRRGALDHCVMPLGAQRGRGQGYGRTRGCSACLSENFMNERVGEYRTTSTCFHVDLNGRISKASMRFRCLYAWPFFCRFLAATNLLRRGAQLHEDVQ